MSILFLFVPSLMMLKYIKKKKKSFAVKMKQVSSVRLTVRLSRGAVVVDVPLVVLAVEGRPLLDVLHERRDEGVHLDGLAGKHLRRKSNKSVKPSVEV